MSLVAARVPSPSRRGWVTAILRGVALAGAAYPLTPPPAYVRGLWWNPWPTTETAVDDQRRASTA